MNEVYTIRSEEGDEYKLQFTTNRSGVIVFNRVTVVEGMAENYYFHVIARRHHLVYADMISVGIQKDYGKPSEE